MINPPQRIRSIGEAHVLGISWPDGATYHIPFQFLRGRCPCAACVDENTGVRIVDVDSIPSDIQLRELAYSGNYALKIMWSDRHATGLFTWEYLAELCRDPAVISVSSD